VAFTLDLVLIRDRAESPSNILDGLGNIAMYPRVFLFLISNGAFMPFTFLHTSIRFDTALNFNQVDFVLSMLNRVKQSIILGEKIPPPPSFADCVYSPREFALWSHTRPGGHGDQ
jgi:hypothetical protein